MRPLPNLKMLEIESIVHGIAAYPVIRRAAMNWGSLKAEHMIAAPTTIMEDPTKIVLRRPNLSPMKIVVIAPKKQPSV